MNHHVQPLPLMNLCLNQCVWRELSHHNRTPFPAKKRFDSFDPPVRTFGEDSILKNSSNEIYANALVSKKPENKQKLTEPQMNKIQDSDEITVHSKENNNPLEGSTGILVEVYVKWEVSKEHAGKFITTLKVVKDATLADLRKLIEIHIGAEKQAFTFLVPGDPTGDPVPREKEAKVYASKLPICNQLHGHLACLRPVKGIQGPNHLPLSPLKNILNVTAAR